MQRYASVSLLAHGTSDYQISLVVITNDILSWRICNLVVSADLLPLLDALGAEDVLALSTLFRFKHDHLADAAHEVLVKLLVFTLLNCCASCSGTTICTLNPAERGRVNLHGDVCSEGFAACHDLFDLLILQFEEAEGVLFAIQVSCKGALRGVCRLQRKIVVRSSRANVCLSHILI